MDRFFGFMFYLKLILEECYEKAGIGNKERK